MAGTRTAPRSRPGVSHPVHVSSKELQKVLMEVVAELEDATAKFPPMNTPHEGYAVILEELDELWESVKTNRGDWLTARTEATQLAAMALRYLLDIDPRRA